MRALLPHAAPAVDLVEAYAVAPPPGATRPFVRAMMISSLDGAVSVGGRSGQLGGRADRRVFQVLRSLADAVLVGAGTVRAEGYGPVHLDDGLRRARDERGQEGMPPIAVVTRSGRLDWDAPFFTSVSTPGARPIVFAPARVVAAMSARAGPAAEVVAAGGAETAVGDDAGVDVRRVIGDLGARGYRTVLVEGGPELNAAIVGAGLLDELCLTVAPRLAGGGGPGVLGGTPLELPIRTRLLHLLEEDEFLFCRLALVPPAGAGG